MDVSTNSKLNNKNENVPDMSDYITNITAHDSQVDNITNNTEIENNITTENAVNQKNTIGNNIIGKEEQESKNENIEENNKRSAIELAKKEWDISVDSYNFEALYISEGIYEVTVRNKTDGYVNIVYTVNVKTGTVTE